MASCKFCFWIQIPWDGIPIKDYGKSSQQLQASARSGCRICGLLQEGIACFIPEWYSLCDDTDKDVSIGFDVKGPSRSLPVDVLIVRKDRSSYDQRFKRLSYTLEFYTTLRVFSRICVVLLVYFDPFNCLYRLMLAGQPTPYDFIGPSPQASWNPSIAGTNELISRWIRICGDNHSSKSPSHTGSTASLCPPIETHALPTRILDLGSAGTPADPVLKETHGLAAKYISLSHCWGQSQPIKTTHSVLEKWKEGIPWSMLPQTFRDAIVITRRLGIQYLWIDALCIIQDDPVDWEQESSEMASIYGNSYLTIAATFAADGNGGCFPKIATSDLQPRKLTSHTLSGEQCTVFVRKQLLHNPYSDRYNEPFDTPPLLKRAWTFQEYLLAPRVLQCTQSEFIWVCNSTLCCECSYLNPDDVFVKSEHAELIAMNRNKLSKSPEKGSMPLPGPSNESQVTDLANHWDELVLRYTGRRLTFFSDKLPALSGIARQMQPCLGPGYFAGLWEQDLLHGLFWEVQPHVYPHRTADFNAPTWSWASVDGQVQYRARLDVAEPHAQIMTIHCLPLGRDPTGQVAKGASITIRAELIAVQLVHKLDTLAQTRLQYYVSKEQEEDNYSIFRDRFVHADYQLAEHGAFYLPPGQLVFCLRLGTPIDRNYPVGEAWCQTLALQQIAEGVYIRFGMVGLSAQTTLRWFHQVPKSVITIL